MFKLVKYITYFLSAKKLYENPDEVIGEVPIAYIQGLFVTSMTIIGLMVLALLGFGFYFNIFLLKIFGFLFLIILVVEVIIYSIIIKRVKKFIAHVNQKTREYLSRKPTRT